jgi:hypothetical protein
VLLVRSKAHQLAANAAARICAWLGVDDSDEAIDTMCHPTLAVCPARAVAGIGGGGCSDYLRDPVLRPTALPDTLDIPGDWRRPVAAAHRLQLAGDDGLRSEQ